MDIRPEFSFRDFLKYGFVDPDAPDELRPELREEEGNRLMALLYDIGVNDQMIGEAAQIFHAQDEGMTSPDRIKEARETLLSAVYSLPDAPRFYRMFLQEALVRVNDPDQWHGLLLLLQRLEFMLAFTQSENSP